jgi:uncharacterized protein YbaR (Trm112 family)
MFQSGEVSPVPVDPELLAILACPACRNPLVERAVGEGEASPATDGLFCAACRRLYPVRDGIPVLLVEEAQVLP